MEHIPSLRISSNRCPHFPEATFIQDGRLESGLTLQIFIVPGASCFSMFASHCDSVHLRLGGQPVCVCVCVALCSHKAVYVTVTVFLCLSIISFEHIPYTQPYYKFLESYLLCLFCSNIIFSRGVTTIDTIHFTFFVSHE